MLDFIYLTEPGPGQNRLDENHQGRTIIPNNYVTVRQAIYILLGTVLGVCLILMLLMAFIWIVTKMRDARTDRKLSETRQFLYQNLGTRSGDITPRNGSVILHKRQI